MGPARKHLMVVSFSGRKTGRQYSIPLSAHWIDDILFALTGYDGKTTTMRGEAIDDAAGYGAKEAQRSIGVKFRDNQLPTLEEFTEAVDRLNLVAIRFTPSA